MTIAFVLAFGFASPWILGGLVLAGVPILIHLLHKRRFIEAPWAAMRFLIEATRKQSRRMRLENLILLMVRTLILLLIVLALARPHFDTNTNVITQEQPDRKSTRLNSSHVVISYAVFCLKKKMFALLPVSYLLSNT